MTNNQLTAQRIKARREALKMTQDELATRLGYSDKTAISKVERGVNGLSSKRIRQFATALNTSVAFLTGETDDPEDVWSRPLVDAPLVLTDDEEVMIHKLRELPDRDRDYVLKVLDFVYSAYQRYIEEGSEDAGV